MPGGGRVAAHSDNSDSREGVLKMRPDGWEKEHPDPCAGCKDKVKPGLGDLTSAKFCLDLCTRDREYSKFEAGADAMLEGLRGDGIPDGKGGSYKLVHWLKPRKATFSGFMEEEQ